MAKASGSIDLKTYNSASQEATNYISYDPQTGLTVGQEDLDSKVVISGGGIKLYDETGKVGTQISSGEVIVGTDETNKIAVNPNGISMTDIDGVESFSVGPTLNTETGELTEITSSENTYELVYTPIADSSITVIRSAFVPTPKPHISTVKHYFKKGTPSTSGTVTYDGNKTFTGVASNFEALLKYQISYFTNINPPYITFGSRTEIDRNPLNSDNDVEYSKGSYSSTFGKELVAEHMQTVVGQANKLDVNGDYAFIVGNGTPNTLVPGYLPIRSNAMAVDWNGNARVKGDVYVGCNSDSTGGNKLVSASATSGSGTKSDVATGTAIKNLTTVSLPDAGVYMLLGLARFDSNANGRRGLAWGSTATGYFDNSLVVVPPVNGAITRIQSMAIVTVASAPFNVYLNCYHTAGTSLNVDYYWRYIKLA